MDIKLKDFEGPLDLLLHLVSKYEVDIYDVPIVTVIEQYLAYIATLQEMKLEVAGDYMVMASQLMVIKSQKLLPIMQETHAIEELPEYDLLQQIEEYRQFKEISQTLGQQHDERAKHFSKIKDDIIVSDLSLKSDKTPIDLYLAFAQIMTKKREELEQKETVVTPDRYKIEDMMERLEMAFVSQKRLSFTQIFQESDSIYEVVTLFLAVLELVKLGTLMLQQEHAFADIVLERVEDESVFS